MKNMASLTFVILSLALLGYAWHLIGTMFIIP